MVTVAPISRTESLANPFRPGNGVPPPSLAGLASLVAFVGLGWMVRIWRGPRDKPPRWRYRDR